MNSVDTALLNERELLYCHLASFGDAWPLKTWHSAERVQEQIKEFSDRWVFYNPEKPNFRRWGLSLTSLDGQLSGKEDLTSLGEYNLRHGTHFNELSFREPTEALKKCTELHSLIEPLKPYLGRSHLLKFGKLGSFPFHRDSMSFGTESFRIFVPLYLHAPRDFVFKAGGRQLELEVGRPYFINTRLEHYIFVFDEPSVHLVLNVELNRESVEIIKSLMFSN